MKLPKGIKDAVHMGAAEVFFEWPHEAIEDPAALLAGGDLGTTYQNILSPDLLSLEDAKRTVADLAAWDRPEFAGDGSHAAWVEHASRLIFDAGVEFARGILALASDPGQVPAHVLPYRAALTPLVDRLNKARAEGELDEESLDLEALVLGDEA